MMRSLFSGVAGLKSHQTRMGTVGNNISNVNTVGFKSSRTTFADTLYQTLSGASGPTGTHGGTNPKQIGLGTGVASIDTIFTDGSVQSTGKNTDLCISGSGLFVVKNASGTYYTRDGAFEFDSQGNYVLPGSGLFVQGWMGNDGKLDTTSAPGNITIQAGKMMQAAATTTANYKSNLSSSTTGSAVTNIQVKYADGTSDSLTSYTPNVIRNGGITLTLNDGSLVTVDSGSSTYKVGDSIGTSSLYTSNVASITATATGNVKLTTDIGSYTKVNNGTSPITISGLSSGTYANGNTYTAAQVIDTVTANTDGTVTLTFKSKANGSATDSITDVTVPDPKNGTYKPGDSFSVNLKISNVEGAANSVLKLENGQSATATADIKIGDSFTKKGENQTITAITRTETGKSVYMLNGKEVSSVDVITADGTTNSGLIGQPYKKDDTYYPSLTTTISVFDSQGNSHSVPVLFTKTASNTWGLSLPGGGDTYNITEKDGSTTAVKLTSSALQFTNTGAYDSGTASLALTYGNGAAAGNVTLNLSGLTQYASTSNASAEANGNADGTLKSVSVDSTGTITGTYTNGVTQKEAQVAIAQFNNPAGLTKNGGNLYTKSNNSGEPNVKVANALGVTITPSALEMSNVDIANEFSDMIITQRGFQSNSKIITVGDEMLETLINMKR